MSDAGMSDPKDVEVGLTGRPVRKLPAPAPLVMHGPAKIIAMCNEKGGVGRTTSTINLGACLAELGRKVLLVDLHPQGALSAGLGMPPEELDITVSNLLLDKTSIIHSAIHHTATPNLDMVPANIDLSAAEVQLLHEVDREQTLARVLRPVMKHYDYIILDCQPSLGLLTVNALACAHGVIIPIEWRSFSLRGLAPLTDTVEKVRDRFNFDLEIVGILVTMFDCRSSGARKVMSRVVEVFGDRVFDSVITRTNSFPETSVAGEPITSWAPKSDGAEQYRALAREVLERTR